MTAASPPDARRYPLWAASASSAMGARRLWRTRTVRSAGAAHWRSMSGRARKPALAERRTNSSSTEPTDNARPRGGRHRFTSK